MSCPSTDQIFSFIENALTPRAADEIREHLDTDCPSCSEQVSQLTKVRCITAGRRLVDPPAWLVRQTQRLFERRNPAPHMQMANRILAFLVVDTFAEGRLLGFRGTGPRSRQMLYRADGYDVDLSIDYVESLRAIEIIGQALPVAEDLSSVAEAKVELLDGLKVATATTINALGEFILDGVEEKVYDLSIRLADTEIMLPSVEAIARPGRTRRLV